MRKLLSKYILSKVMSSLSIAAGRCSQQMFTHYDGLAHSATRSISTLRPCVHFKGVCSSRRSLHQSTDSIGIRAGLSTTLRKVNTWGRSHNAEEAVTSTEAALSSAPLPLNDVGTIVVNPSLGTILEAEATNGTVQAAALNSSQEYDGITASSASNNGHMSQEAGKTPLANSGDAQTAAESNGHLPTASGTAVAAPLAAVEQEACSNNSSDTAEAVASEASISSSSVSSDTAADVPSSSGSADCEDESSTSSSSNSRAGPAIRLLLQSGAAMLPHPDKAHRGGEDSFFIADHQSAIGVADGVGGWAEIGVDAGAYARLLMVHAKEAADAAADDLAAGTLSAQQILETAFYKTNVQGSSTACVLVVNGTTLSASNLGDSGFLLVRDGVAFFQCPQQQHNFNFPFQLGSADSMSDQPQAAMRFELELQPGDIVVTGSDGLWDNIFAEEAATIASKCRDKGESATTAAQVLCRYARMRASDAKYHSPFSYAAIQAGYVYLGGKMDDITVVVSYVTLPGAKL